MMQKLHAAVKFCYNVCS